MIQNSLICRDINSWLKINENSEKIIKYNDAISKLIKEPPKFIAAFDNRSVFAKVN